jgi:hypothetical protein
MNVKFLAQENNGLPLIGFEPTRSAILRLLIRRVNHSVTPPIKRLQVHVIIHSCFNWFLFPIVKVYFLMTYNQLVVGLFVLMQKGRLLKVNLSVLQQKVWQYRVNAPFCALTSAEARRHIKSLSFKGEGYNKCEGVCRCQITKVHWCFCNV